MNKVLIGSVALVLFLIAVPIILFVTGATYNHRMSPQMAITLHFTNMNRVRRILDDYHAFLDRYPIYATYVKVLTGPLDRSFIERFERITAVENEGLDIGGWLTATKQVPDNIPFILKLHDKADYRWFQRQLDPLIAHEGKYEGFTSAQSEIVKFAANDANHAYWVGLLCRDLGIDKPSRFAAGSIFVIPTEKAKAFQNSLDRKGYTTRLTRFGRFCPSWYQYVHGFHNKEFPIWTADKIYMDPVTFEIEMASRKKGAEFANGMEMVSRSGKTLINGWAIRDAQIEHAIERIIGHYCGKIYAV